MNILVLLDEPYPFGMACTNRIHNYAKGLTELGNNVQLLIPRPIEKSKNTKNTLTEGQYEGVKFIYSSNSTIRNKNYIKRIVLDLSSFVNAFRIILQFKPDIILIASSFIRFVLLGKFASLFSKSKLVREKSELPYFRISTPSIMIKKLITLEYKLFNGFIAISDNLKQFLVYDLKLKSQIIVVPILVDCCQTQEPSKPVNTINYRFVYTGSLVDAKDGVLNIIKAFSIIISEFKSAKLILTGDINKSPDKKKILKLIDDLKLNKCVRLAGYLSRIELLALRQSATALVVAKPYSKQNFFNMATKIGEYLSTGRPVILTSIDPAANIIKHGISGYIAEPNPKSLANQMKNVLLDTNKANCIGLKGKEIAISYLNYKKQSLKIHNFLKDLI